MTIIKYMLMFIKKDSFNLDSSYKCKILLGHFFTNVISLRI
jgi:hypothetical protein